MTSIPLYTTLRSAKRETFLADVIITAVEGGIGYWSSVQTYRWSSNSIGHSNDSRPLGLAPNGGDNAYAVIQDMETGDGVDYEVTLDKVASAVRKIVAGETNLAADYVGRIAQANAENDACYIDSLDADAIVQVATLGTVTYG